MDGEDLTRARLGQSRESRHHGGDSPTSTVGENVAKYATVTPIRPGATTERGACIRCGLEHSAPLCLECWRERIDKDTREANARCDRELRAWSRFKSEWSSAGNQHERDDLERRFAKALPHIAASLMKRWIVVQKTREQKTPGSRRGGY